MDYCRPAASPTHGDDRLRIAGNSGVIESMQQGERVVYIHPEDGAIELELDEKRDQFVDFVGSIRGENESWVPAEDCIRMTEITLKLREVANSDVAADLS